MKKEKSYMNETAQLHPMYVLKTSPAAKKKKQDRALTEPRQRFQSPRERLGEFMGEHDPKRDQSVGDYKMDLYPEGPWDESGSRGCRDI